MYPLILQSPVFYVRVTSVSCQRTVHATTTVDFTTPTTPSLKTATHGNICNCLTVLHWFCHLNGVNSRSLFPTVCVRNAAGNAAVCPVLESVWRPATRTTSRSMDAATLSSATASTCWPGRAAACSASQQRTCLVEALVLPAPSQSLWAWETPSYICWEVGATRWGYNIGSIFVDSQVRCFCVCPLGKAVTVNGMPVSLPKSYSGSGLTLERVGLFVSLSSRLGVTLLWDGGKTHKQQYKMNIFSKSFQIHTKSNIIMLCFSVVELYSHSSFWSCVHLSTCETGK